MKQIEVLMVVDVYGWAFDFITDGIIANISPEFKVEKKTGSEVTVEDSKFDIVLFPFYPLSMRIGRKAREAIRRNCKVILTFHDDFYFHRIFKNHFLTQFDGIGAVNERLYKEIRQVYPNINLHLIESGVDTNIFKPMKGQKSQEFTVGWAGNAGRPFKRTYLLKRLSVSVKMKSKWSVAVTMKSKLKFGRNRNRQEMVDFYNSLDAYVCVSTSTETGPLPVLEASACGLPVVSTPCGIVPKLIEKEWLVPFPEKELVSEMNRKLTILKEDAHLRLRVGNRNLEEARKNWSWEVKVKNYEKLFRSVG